MINAYKRTTSKDKVMIVDDLKQAMRMREISLIWGSPIKILLNPQIQKCHKAGSVNQRDNKKDCI
ncbi:MAG: hypothetical protein QXV17_09450 [Candidatus Micrarchaeaceae archaeon]